MLTENQFRSTVNPKKPSPPKHGVDMTCIVLTAEQPVGKGQYPPPASLRVIPIHDTAAQFIFEQPKGRPGQPPPAKRDPLPNFVENIKAFQRPMNVSWKKNDPVSSIHKAGIYKIVGLEMKDWDRDEEVKLEDGTVVTQRKVTYKPMMNNMYPVVSDSVESIIRRTPFEKLRVVPEVDFYNPFSSVPYSTSWEDARSLLIELKPSAPLPANLDHDWFPGQPNGTIYARLPAVEDLMFLYAPENAKAASPTLQGVGNNDMQMYVCQKEVDGTVVPISLVSRFYEDCIMAFQLPKWDIMGPIIVPHLAGQLVGSTQREGCQKAYIADSKYFKKGGFLYAYLKLLPDFRTIVTSACEPGPFRCGLKLQASLAAKFMQGWKDDFSNFPVSPWANGINILAYHGVRTDLLSDEIFDFYLISNYDWQNVRNVEAVMKMTSDDELYAEFGRKGQIVAVFACLKSDVEGVALNVALTEGLPGFKRQQRGDEDEQEEEEEEEDTN
jgi:hypothetical protein